MDNAQVVLLVVCVLGGLIVIGLPIAWYNKLVRLRQLIRESWGNVDVQLRRRYDLIPNLVNTVKGYAAHEKDTLERVIQARAKATSATLPADVIKAEGELSSAIARLLAVSEAYPELKANQNFLALQEELTSTENRVA